MPLFDYACPAGHQFEVLVGGANAFAAPTECPDCGSPEFTRLWTFDGHVSTTTFDAPGDVAMHLQHKKWIEDEAAKGNIVSIKERGPLEYRPRFERRLH